ncbi:MAG: hypothetical protein RLZZ283_251 [Candidatus Parcubacteria bacterium]|jgi:hypothetical protein
MNTARRREGRRTPEENHAEKIARLRSEKAKEGWDFFKGAITYLAAGVLIAIFPHPLTFAIALVAVGVQFENLFRGSYNYLSLYPEDIRDEIAREKRRVEYNDQVLRQLGGK